MDVFVTSIQYHCIRWPILLSIIRNRQKFQIFKDNIKYTLYKYMCLFKHNVKCFAL
jgi:hypothetical protein